MYEEAVRRTTLVAARLQLGATLRLAQHAAPGEVLEAAVKRAPGAQRSGMIGARAPGSSVTGPSGRVHRRVKAIAIDPDLAEAHNTLAGVWLATGDTAKAEASVREAIRIRPEFADAQKNLGSLLSAAGDLAQACYHFEIALRLEPRLVSARYNYGLALARLRRFDAAQMQMETVLRDAPEHAEAHQAMGALLAARGSRRHPPLSRSTAPESQLFPGP
jgi:Flp pilus assembly protein TadD